MAGILSVQINSILGDKKANLDKVTELVGQYKGKPLDLVVVPEFFSTNIDYTKSPEDEDGGDTIKFMQRLAIEYNTNVVAGSVVRKVDGKLYNTSFAINRSGEVVEKYDKVHLFNYMGGTEGERITAGDELKVVQFDFAKVGMTICFDMRYPVYINKIAREGAQIIVMPTAWLVPKEIFDNKSDCEYAQEMFVSMCRTRAYDNMTYFVVSNLVSGEVWKGIGNSMIISPTAQVLENAKLDEKAVYADIDVECANYLQTICPIVNAD